MSAENNPSFVVCQYSCIPLRGQPDLISEMVSQVLFGERAEILERKNRFLRVRLVHDAYEGWADERHFIPEAGGTPGYEWVTGDLIGVMQGQERTLLVPLGTPMPQFDHGNCTVAGRTYEYRGKAHKMQRFRPADLLAWGHSLHHTPYLWGGRTPMGLDCSGLAQLIHRLAGIHLGRDTVHQIAAGIGISQLSEANLGDLVFFCPPQDRTLHVNHVGIVWENHQILHASGSVRIDHLTVEGILHSDSGTLTHRLLTIRRCGLVGG